MDEVQPEHRLRHLSLSFPNYKYWQEVLVGEMEKVYIYCGLLAN